MTKRKPYIERRQYIPPHNPQNCLGIQLGVIAINANDGALDMALEKESNVSLDTSSNNSNKFNLEQTFRYKYSIQ